MHLPIFWSDPGSFRPNASGGIKYFQQDSAQRNYYNRYNVVEPYFQDDWRVTSRLTLNLGLRISLFGLWHEKYNNVYNWVPSALQPCAGRHHHCRHLTGGLSVAGSCDATGQHCTPIPLNLSSLDPRITNGLVRCGFNGVPDGCMTNHFVNPAPRVGFAWDPTGTGKTSIRAGYGMFFHHGTGNEANTGSLEGSAPMVLDMTQNRPYDLRLHWRRRNHTRNQQSLPGHGSLSAQRDRDSHQSDLALRPAMEFQRAARAVEEYCRHASLTSAARAHISRPIFKSTNWLRIRW